ncbi:hypothetical protein HK102_001227 [Quaeritorhiza haematococci]|nr:hypothetical protein HK102_001227 [Quaeritorhiza haematococci]
MRRRWHRRKPSQHDPTSDTPRAPAESTVMETPPDPAATAATADSSPFSPLPSIPPEVISLADPDSNFITLLGLRVHYKIVSPQHPPSSTHSPTPPLEPIILLHPFVSPLPSFRKVMQPIADATGRTVIAYDRVPFGLTERPSMENIKSGRFGRNDIKAEGEVGDGHAVLDMDGLGKEGTPDNKNSATIKDDRLAAKHRKVKEGDRRRNPYTLEFAVDLLHAVITTFTSSSSASSSSSSSTSTPSTQPNRKAILLGCSNGGTVALKYYLTYPHHVRSLLLFDTPLIREGGPPTPVKSLLRISWIQSLFVYLLSPLLKSPRIMSSILPYKGAYFNLESDELRGEEWERLRRGYLTQTEALGFLRAFILFSAFHIFSGLWDVMRGDPNKSFFATPPRVDGTDGVTGMQERAEWVPILFASGRHDKIAPYADSVRVFHTLAKSRAANPTNSITSLPPTSTNTDLTSSTQMELESERARINNNARLPKGGVDNDVMKRVDYPCHRLWFRTIEECGHLPAEEKPKDMIEMVTEFVISLQ